MCLKVMEKLQSTGEEIANSVLHGAGVLLAAAGLVLLTLRAKQSVPAYVIFAAAMILMFLASTMYHALVHRKAKEIFRIFDHQAIYLFIAGTYTPYCLLALKAPLGWILLVFEWTLAIAGVVLSAFRCRFLKKAELVIFILMGWAIIAGSIPLARALSLKSLVLLFAGGAAYTAGTFWYRAGKDRPLKQPEQNSALSIGRETPPAFRPRLPGAHVVWHVFVLAGAVCHWFSLWFLAVT